MRTSCAALCFWVVLAVSTAEALFPFTAQADDLTHLMTFETRATRFSTRLGSNAVSIVSPFGVGLTYALRASKAWQFSAQGVAVFGKKNIILYGTGLHADYAYFGGHSSVVSGPDSSRVSIQYPARLGVFLGGIQRTFDLDGTVDQNTLTFEKKLPLRGNFVGAEFGLSAETPLGAKTMALARLSYAHPVFLSDSEQEGSLVSLSVGLGMSL